MSARVVAATHKDPMSLREDLYYRLRAYGVTVPPLRERTGDLPLLIDHFLKLAAKDLGRPAPAAPAHAATYLARHPFPGNIRELSAIVFDAVARHVGGDMPVEMLLQTTGIALPVFTAASGTEADRIIFPAAMPTLDTIESAAIQEALKRADGNVTAAARLLNVSRNRLRRNRVEPELRCETSEPGVPAPA